MWCVMASAQQNYHLSERLIRAISNWRVFAGANDDVEELIDLGADVNAIHGTLLPIHCACMVSDHTCLKLLLEKGARVNEVDGYGRTALHYAAERDAYCVKLLLQHGADINAGDGNQDTPLHWAAYKDNVACVKVLLQNSAFVDIRDYNEDTPLAWAARKGHLEVIQILLEYNANVDKQNLVGDTPLVRAATMIASGLDTELDDAVLELLIKASGQFDIRNNKGELIRNIGQDNRMTELLLPLCENPKKLQDLCRTTIRSRLGYRYLPHYINKLPLPLGLCEYILLHR